MRAPLPPSCEKILNRGVTQQDRAAAAPAPDDVAVDGRSLAQLLAFAARFGALVRFYDLDDRPNGDWTEFFALDPAIANAVHGALDIPEIERELRRLLAEIRDGLADEACLAALRRLIGVLVQLLGILDRTWRHDDDPWAALAVLAAIDRRGPLAEPLRALRHHLSKRDPKFGAEDHWHRHHRDWVKQFLSIVEDVVLSLLDELRHGLQSSLDAAEASLGSRGHAPQAALYDAFAVLFTEARREMNRFPRRLLDFYYGGILRQERREEKPARLFLTFTLATGAEQADIPKGSLFSAGKDPAGQAIYYAADTALDVTPAAVTQLSVHRVLLDGADGAAAAVTGVVSGTAATAADGTTPAEPFPIFGGGDLDPSGALALKPATVGFGVTGKTLTLMGGTRTVVIGLSPPATHQTLDAIDQTTAEAIGNSFSLYYTTAGAWVPIQDVAVTPGSVPGSLTFTFTLPPDAPPMVALSTLPAADPQAVSLPASAFPSPGPLPAVIGLFQWQAEDGGSQVDAFATLSQLPVDTASIAVTVSGLAPAALSGSGGAMDPSQNFPLFGLTPAQKSQLRLSVPELFLKQPDSLSVTIDWAGLPVTSDGFLGYYKGYRIDADGNRSPTPLFDNTTFTAGLGVLSPGEWTTSDAAGQLFAVGASDMAAAGAGGILEPTSVLGATIEAGAAPPYYDPSASLLTLTLAEPAYAFGNSLYSSNLTAATNANIAALRGAGTASASANASAQISAAAAANASTADKSHSGAMKEAIGKAASALNGSVLSALRKAVAASGADAGTRSDWLGELETAVSAKIDGGGLRGWLTGGKEPDAATIGSRLGAWLQAHEQQLSAAVESLLQQAGNALSAQGTLASALETTAGQSVAAARATLSAALEQAQATLVQSAPSSSGVPLPNPPWLPMASAVTVGYQASSALQVAPSLSLDALSPETVSEGFYHLDLFDQLAPAGAGAGPTVSILPDIARQAALYIEVSPPAAQLSLLFILQAGPEGWSNESPTLCWEQRIGLSWRRVTVLADGTDNLLNSGVVTLQLHKLPASTADTLIRVRLVSGMANAPYVKSVTANAVTATWVGPGGADQLGEPLPAGTVTTAKNAIAGLGTIDQPEDSEGGIPPATGKAFDLWMAERLRHKGYAIDAWDYARHALAEVPILWQAAVVPAADSTGTAAPGHVWVVAVGGPRTPNVSDPTEPIVSPETLGEIGQALASVASPFITIDVTNPPYRRVTVVAEIVFTDDDTVAANSDRLNAELVKWLSPWPAPELGPRPDDYYTRQAIADFVSRRRYVRGLASLRLKLEPEPPGGWSYLTSAEQHRLHGIQDGAAAAGNEAP